jgi:hypothetical protein
MCGIETHHMHSHVHFRTENEEEKLASVWSNVRDASAVYSAFSLRSEWCGLSG